MAYVDHRIPAANLIGEAGRGLPQILGVLEVGRINIAARAVGVARAAFDAALAYAQHARPSASPSPSTRPSSSSWPTWPPASRPPGSSPGTPPSARPAGLRCDVEAGMAKLFASETALELATESMRIHGGMGYTDRPARRALLPGRAADGDRRGNQRDPAPGHRPRPPGPGPRRRLTDTSAGSPPEARGSHQSPGRRVPSRPARRGPRRCPRPGRARRRAAPGRRPRRSPVR